MALNIVKATDALKLRNATVVIYGEPGAGKTTIAQTASRPLTFLFDTEGGVRAGLRDDLIQVIALQETADQIRRDDPTAKVMSWREVVREFNPADDLSNYDSVIVDTVGEMIETLKVFHTDDNVKNRGSFDGLSGQGWGAVSSSYRWLAQRVHAGGCDLIIVGQAREEQNRQGNTVERLEASGRAKQIIMSHATQVGWLGTIGNQRILGFRPEEGRYTKDSANIGNVKVPSIEDDTYRDFLARTIELLKSRINKRNEGTGAPVAEAAPQEPPPQPELDSDVFSDSPGEEPAQAPGLTDEVLQGFTEEVHRMKQRQAPEGEQRAFAKTLGELGAKWDSKQQRVVRAEPVS